MVYLNKYKNVKVAVIKINFFFFDHFIFIYWSFTIFFLLRGEGERGFYLF